MIAKKQKATNWLTTQFHVVFLLLLTGFLVTGSMTNRDAYLLKTATAPYGIISLELTVNNSDKDSILKEWDANYYLVRTFYRDTTPINKVSGIQAAIRQNNFDYGFIVFYSLILLLFVTNLAIRHPDKFSIFDARLYAGLAIAAGLMDLFEDIGIGRMLHGFGYQPVPAAYVGIPGIIKWILLTIIAARLLIAIFKLRKPTIWLEELSVLMTIIANNFWRFRVVIITLLVFFLLLFISDQGQDLLLTINSSRWASGYFLLTITILAMLCWHLPKAIDNAENLSFGQFFMGPVDYIPNTRDSHKRPSIKVDIGRLLGTAGFIIPATGILKTMQVYHIHYALDGFSPMLLMAALLILYYVVLKYHWIDWFYKSDTNTIKPIRYWITMAALAAPLVFNGFFTGNNNRQPYFLVYLSLDLILLSAMFLVTVTLRTCVLSIKKFNIAPWITFSGAALALLFIAFNIPVILNYFTRNERFYTMPMVFCAVAGYLLLFSFLLFTGKKTGIKVVSLLLLFTLYQSASKVTNYHNIAVTFKADTTRHMDSLRTYARNWLINRRDEINGFVKNNPGRPYPVFFVNAYGGGIRATVWTTMVIGTLDSLVKKRQPKGQKNATDFQHYVFSFSGASGGTIGLALLSGSRYPHLQNTAADSLFNPSASLPVYQHDYLSSDIMALLGRDMFASSLGFSWWKDDRARLLEKDWEIHTGAKNIFLAATMGKLWANSQYKMPLLFSNTYDIESGKKGITAPVILDSVDFPSTLFLEQELDKQQDLRLSTAAFMSARFPYVSPTGKLNGKHHFTDGGTWDNSGAETSLQIISVFLSEIDKLSKDKTNTANEALQKIKPQLISIINSMPVFDNHGKVKNLFEPLAPLLGILNVRSGFTRKADNWNQSLSKLRGYGYFVMRVTPERIRNEKDSTKFILPVLPLGWQISDYALMQMRLSVTKHDILKDSIVNKLILAQY